jgi:hypothetical protein
MRMSRLETSGGAPGVVGAVPESVAVAGASWAKALVDAKQARTMMLKRMRRWSRALVVEGIVPHRVIATDRKTGVRRENGVD